MRMSFGMEARQLQVQKLAPRMIQSMEILQLPVLALEERIEQEMNDNPLLEIQDEPVVKDEFEEDVEERIDPNAPAEDERELVVADNSDQSEDFERVEKMEFELPNTFDDQPGRSADWLAEAGDRQLDLMANAADRPESLNDYLLHQLGELDIDSDVEQMAERIISTLDARDGGYLRTPLVDLLPPNHTKEQLELARRALDVVQHLDPPGIAARDMRECLLLQLDPSEPHYEQLKTLISGHLQELAENRLPQIQRQTGFSLELLNELKEELHKLNPKPGAAFTQAIVPAIQPDVIVEKDDEGEYRVRAADERVPRLFISDYYRRRLQDPGATAEEREYIKKKLTSAQWLIDAIEQRRNTLVRVSQAIIDHQRQVLDEGLEKIEPLKMQQIADRVGVHVTTVSRAVDDKWIQTPRGILPLKRFFAAGTQTESGEDIAWDAIRLKLQELIDNEDKANPCSDDELVDLLQKQGLTVARRTVTKYRKRMGIPSSRQRRDWALSQKKA
jgi:RNA polymerase sigma-54 factor